jgi:hypothetical protein
MLVGRKMGPTMLAARFQHSVTPNALRSYLAEFLSTFFYVFAVVGSAMSSRESLILFISLINCFAIFVVLSGGWIL